MSQNKSVEMKLISIEGNIGSGKSTLVHNLEKKYGNNPEFCFLQEPIDIWNTIKDENGVTILEKFYENNEKYAFAFQMMAYISRLSILKKAIQNKQYKYIITERCLYTDANIFAKMLYDDKKISEIEYSIYTKWFDEFINDIPLTKLIYVKTDAIVANSRVITRGRKGENIPLDYLQRCHEYHEEWINRTTNPKLILDGNMNLIETPHILEDWFNKIINFIE
jgi:deoxyadenosine/deoxycytidine kinase